MNRTSRNLILVVVGGVAVFAAFSIYADVRELGARLRGFGWWAFAAALGLALLNYVIRLFRWVLYLAVCQLDVRLSIASLTFYSGFAMAVTPGKLGELVKSYLLRETCGVPMTRTAPIVIAERVADLLALLILGVIGVALYGVARAMVLAGVAIVLAGLLILAWPRLARGVIGVVCRPRFLQRFEQRLVQMYQGLVALVRPWPLAGSTGLGVLAWLAECTGFSLIVSGFPGTDVPIGLATLIYAVTTVAGALSFLPGGLVVTEATMALLLAGSSHGVDEPTAVAATILTRLATLWFAVVLGLIAMAVLRRLAPVATDALEQAAAGDSGGPEAGAGASGAILLGDDRHPL